MSEKKRRTPEETLRAMREQALLDEAARIKEMTSEEVAAEIRAEGGDPEAIRARGASLAKRLAWQGEARKKLDAARAVLARPGPRKARGLSRAELVARIEAARGDSRFAQPLAVAFRGRTLDASTDEELEAMLDAIEDLERLPGGRE